MTQEQPPAPPADSWAKLYSSGIAVYQTGDYWAAEKIFEQIAAAQPGIAEAWNMRGVCCMMTNRLDEAESFIRQAVAVRPSAGFFSNLGVTLARLDRADEAIAAYRASLTHKPDNAEVCANLADLVRLRGEYEQAQALYRRAIELAPDYTLAQVNLGLMLYDRGEHDQARQFFKTSQAWGALAINLRMRAAWGHLAEIDAAYIDDLQHGREKVVSPLSLLTVPALTPKLQRKAALDFANATYGRALQQPPLIHSVARHGPLRIGYLSSDYYTHATMHLLAGVLEAHDPARVDVHLLSVNARPLKEGDPLAKRIAAMPATFHNLSSASDTEVAQRIAKIQPHLLIDLKGHTLDARLNITAMRPAPVIVNWLGYPGTLGHERLADYIIGDPVVTPPEHAGDFSETLALMPYCYQPNDRSRPLGAPPSRAAEGLPENGFVFCCFNQFTKINPGTFDLWCRLLAATPGSALWLLGEREDGQSNLRREARQRGIAGERLVFVRRKPVAEHMARLQLADLALDTFPYTSHTTASDALWAGVPLVTRIGQTFASRVAASLLTTHGFPELIVQDDEAYFDLVMSLVNQPEKLRQLRPKLAAARLASPLFDTVRFARDLERLYEAIWRQHETPRDQRMPIVLPPQA